MAEQKDVVIPALGESVAEGTIATWHKQVGEAVTRDEAIVEIETDKASVEIVAGADGVLAEVLFAEGADVAPGTVIAKIAEGDTASAPAPAPEPKPEPAPEPKPAPAPEKEPIKETKESAPPAPKPAPATTPTPTPAPAPKPATKPAGDLANQTDLNPTEITRDATSGQVGVQDLTTFLHRHSAPVTQEEPEVEEPETPAPAPTAPAPPPAAKAPVSSSGKNSASLLSPAVERLLAENNLDLASLQNLGSGQDGRLLKGDLLALLAGERPAAQTQETQQTPQADAGSAPVPEFVGKREKMSRMRRTIARRLKEAQNTAALLTTYNEVDLTRVSQLRANYKEAIQERFGVRLGFMGFFLKASALALAEQPTVGAQIEGEEIVYPDGAHIAVAAATPKGLVTPVLRGVEKLTLLEAEAKLAELAGRARAGDIGEDDLAGGSFTISNGGVFGSLLSAPIVNPPQSAILGLHAIQERPVARKGKVVISPMMYLALSYDHRLIDGREAVTFLVRLGALLQQPEALLLGLNPTPDKKA